MNSIREKIETHINSYLPEMVDIRRQIHAHPELAYEEYKTGNLVAHHLEKWGYCVTRNIGSTGVVGTLKAGTSTRSVGIRADMDALPIHETTNLAYASKTPGVMHACGHDGHTAILLAAARYLAETRNFDGTVHLIFQPAEEEKAGAKAMIDDGLFKRFPCDAIFGLHNWPCKNTGTFLYRSGPVAAASDRATITIQGKGGHGAIPHFAVDPIVTASTIVISLQSIVSRNINAQDAVIITAGSIHAGNAANAIPEKAEIELTIRSFNPSARSILRDRIHKIATEQAKSFNAKAIVDYKDGYPVTVNHEGETQFAKNLIEHVFGEQHIETSPMQMGSEDFSFMLQEVPGCYLFLGNGTDSPPLHNSGYDFNDNIILPGAVLWGALAEQKLPLSS